MPFFKYFLHDCGQTSLNFDSWSFWTPPKLVNKKRIFDSKMCSWLWKKSCLSSNFKSPSFQFFPLSMYDLTKTEKWIHKKDGIIIFAVNAFLVKRMKEISWILFDYVILFNLKNVHRVFFSWIPNWIWGCDMCSCI